MSSQEERRNQSAVHSLSLFWDLWLAPTTSTLKFSWFIFFLIWQFWRTVKLKDCQRKKFRSTCEHKKPKLRSQKEVFHHRAPYERENHLSIKSQRCISKRRYFDADISAVFRFLFCLFMSLQKFFCSCSWLIHPSRNRFEGTISAQCNPQKESSLAVRSFPFFHFDFLKSLRTERSHKQITKNYNWLQSLSCSCQTVCFLALKHTVKICGYYCGYLLCLTGG